MQGQEAAKDCASGTGARNNPGVKRKQEARGAAHHARAASSRESKIPKRLYFPSILNQASHRMPLPFARRTPRK